MIYEKCLLSRSMKTLNHSKMKVVQIFGKSSFLFEYLKIKLFWVFAVENEQGIFIKEKSLHMK